MKTPGSQVLTRPRQSLGPAVVLLVAVAASPRASGATSPQAADDAARPLTTSECESLGQWIAAACADHPNTRSAQIDSWCGDVTRTVGDGTWVTGDCTKHVRYMDAVCFRSTTQIRAIMDCDRNVDRP